eukprot:TRINITY_DN10291_c0_g2_i2.p1 TRINITY_DN10291_c0_g2~~TRINITY_DN10291_c0_g2_i2.p1  ORF type:complete len:637 (-),score=195.53 TRINITY_DN10291_c0_g2_i2:152-2062(-)
MLGLRKQCKRVEKDLKKAGLAFPRATQTCRTRAGTVNHAAEFLDETMRLEAVNQVLLELQEAAEQGSVKMIGGATENCTKMLEAHMSELRSETARLTKLEMRLNKELKILAMEAQDLSDVKNKLSNGVEAALEELLPVQEEVSKLRTRHSVLLGVAAMAEQDGDKHRELLVGFFQDLANDGEEPIADAKALATLLETHLNWLATVDYGSELKQVVETAVTLMTGQEDCKGADQMWKTVQEEVSKQLGRSSLQIAENIIKLLDPSKAGVPRDAMEALLDLTHRPSSAEDRAELVSIAVFTLMDTDQSGECNKEETTEFIRAALLCGVELVRILLEVFKTAFVMPLLKKAVATGIEIVDADRSGEVSLPELKDFTQGLIAADSEDEEVPWRRIARGGHLDEDSRVQLKAVLDETQILGMIVTQGMQMAGSDGLDLDSFSDMSSNMMANQLDLLLTLIPSLPPPDHPQVPDALHSVIAASKEFSTQVRDHSAENTEGIVEKYFKFLDRNGSEVLDRAAGSVDQEEFECAIQLIDPKLETADKITSLFKLLDADRDGEVTAIEIYGSLSRLIAVVMEMLVTLLSSFEELVKDGSAAPISNALISEYISSKTVHFDYFPDAFGNFVKDANAVLEIIKDRFE